VLATPPLNSLEELESNLKPECVDGNGIIADRVDAAKPVVMAVRAAVPWPQKLIASGAMIVAAEGSRKSDKSTFLTEQSLDLLTNPIARSLNFAIRGARRSCSLPRFKGPQVILILTSQQWCWKTDKGEIACRQQAEVYELSKR
jgi:hypothetical protein